MIGVVICDDHPLVADGLASILALQPDIEVRATAASVQEVVLAARTYHPDVVLMDYELLDGTGIDATRSVLEECRITRVVMLTSFVDDAVLVGAIEAGATGFITKHSTAAALADAVRLAAAGEAVIPPDLLARLLPRLSRTASRGVQVSDREREILGLLSQGASNHEIAEELQLSPNTVRNHLARIYGRLGARSRLEAVAIAVREGLLPRR